jgi:serine/threonine protein kinase
LTLGALGLDNRGVSRAAAEVGSTANSYQILAKLATGGMAEIFLARGEGVAGVERYCVLKRILRDRASDVHFVRMFLDEARLAAQLQHPNIAQVYDIGKLGDSYFFTMEYVHGETVRSLLHRAQGLRRKLPVSCVLTIAAGTAAGLHHAHTRLGFDGRPLGIVHRDVSPSNLMVSYEGGVKVVDFGVAKAADRGHETKSGTVKGKISYLSPEQCKGKRVDRRSDLFSLGICLWEMLTTERLYRRSSDFENMHAIVNEVTPAPSSRRDDIPREIDELVLRLLGKTADERLQTADEVVEAIEDVASRTGSVLSTSALGKFMRELFGQRPEPWLELENQQEPGEAITVTSEPIPPELAAAPADNVHQQLASVVDLSAPRVATESLDSVASAGSLAPLPPEIPTTQGKRIPLGFPLAAPPPTNPGIPLPPADLPPALPPPPRPTGRSYAVALPDSPEAELAAPASVNAPAPQAQASTQPPPPLPAVVPGLLPAPSGALPATQPSPSGQPPATFGALAATQPSPSEPQPAAFGALPATQASPSEPQPAAFGALPATQASPSEPQPAASGALAATQASPSGPQPTTFGALSATQPSPSGAPSPPSRGPSGTQPPSGPKASAFAPPPGTPVPPSGPQAAFAASSGHLPRVTSAGLSVSAADSHGSPRSSASYRTPVERHGWPFYAVIGGAALVSSLAVMLVMRSDSTSTDAATTATPAGAAVRAADTAAARSPASAITVVPIEPVVADPPTDPAPAGPAMKPITDERSAESPDRSAGAPQRPSRIAKASAPSRTAAPAAAAPGQPPARRDREDEISRFYAAELYDKVVEQCGVGPVNAEHAPLCFLAACHVGNEARARKLIAAVPASRRDQLTVNCKQLGVDIKKPEKAAVDCEADPMACQH